jgi:hypothetical protein
MGATRKEDKKAAPIMNDEKGLIKWSSNIRGIITFEDMSDIIAKQSDLAGILQHWVKIS